MRACPGSQAALSLIGAAAVGTLAVAGAVSATALSPGTATASAGTFAAPAGGGPDWQTNAATQIRWGLSCIQGRYGSPCGAWAHEEADNWY